MVKRPDVASCRRRDISRRSDPNWQCRAVVPHLKQSNFVSAAQTFKVGIAFKPSINQPRFRNLSANPVRLLLTNSRLALRKAPLLTEQAALVRFGPAAPVATAGVAASSEELA